MSQASTYTNPVYTSDFPDPGVLKLENGLYAYASQGLSLQENIQLAFSRDGIYWESKGDALPQKAAWATSQDYWAPHPIYKDGIYYLFYNAKTDISGQGIGVATSNAPEGPFVDSGKPLVYGESYINIDAFVFHDTATNKDWLCWGSCYQPIKLRELDEHLLDFARKSETLDILSPEPNHPFASLHEAPWIHARFDSALNKRFYYLFTSGSNAFGQDSYGIMVARSESLQGAYTSLAEERGLEDSLILRSNAKFMNPGAHAMFTDNAGQDWLLYHAYLREGLQTDYESLRKTARVLLLDPLYYDEVGWPYVLGGTPSTEKRPGPVIR